MSPRGLLVIVAAYVAVGAWVVVGEPFGPEVGWEREALGWAGLALAVACMGYAVWWRPEY